MLGCFWQKTLQQVENKSNKVRLSCVGNKPRFLQRGVNISLVFYLLKMLRELDLKYNYHSNSYQLQILLKLDLRMNNKDNTEQCSSVLYNPNRRQPTDNVLQ